MAAYPEETAPVGPVESMQPDVSRVTLGDNESQIVQLLDEMIVQPRINLISWSKITKQTPNLRIGYPGQHLASLVTGVEGARTGARGHDLVDGTEVKSCSRIDQLDKCNICGAAVARLETECPSCESANIKRNDDSKWLFGIRSDAELEQLINYDRVLLMLGDHPRFTEGDYSELRFQSFEIWPRHPRCRSFAALLQNYYNYIFLPKAEAGQRNIAPKNFWPYSYQFYKCNPIRTMQCRVTQADTSPVITLDYFYDPKADRSEIVSDPMPSRLLNASERELLVGLSDELLAPCLISPHEPAKYRAAADKQRRLMLGFITEDARDILPLRDTDVPVTHQTEYARRSLR